MHLPSDTFFHPASLHLNFTHFCVFTVLHYLIAHSTRLVRRRLIITMMKPLKIDKGSEKNSQRIKMMLKRGGGTAGVRGARRLVLWWFLAKDDEWMPLSAKIPARGASLPQVLYIMHALCCNAAFLQRKSLFSLFYSMEQQMHGVSRHYVCTLAIVCAALWQIMWKILCGIWKFHEHIDAHTGLANKQVALRQAFSKINFLCYWLRWGVVNEIFMKLCQ